MTPASGSSPLHEAAPQTLPPGGVAPLHTVEPLILGYSALLPKAYPHHPVDEPDQGHYVSGRAGPVGGADLFVDVGQAAISQATLPVSNSLAEKEFSGWRFGAGWNYT